MRNRYIFLLFLLAACSSPKEGSSEVQNQPRNVAIVYKGALMSIMHKGDLRTNIQFDTLATKDLYALGALDSLRGELTIDNGTIYMSRVSAGSIEVGDDLSSGAVLYVSAKVSDWLSFSAVGNLEASLERLALNANIEGPFPFKLVGSFKKLDYHIINYNAATTDIANHKEGALKGSLSGKEVTIIGFYSKSHQGIFTHHGSTVHMHVISENGGIMGHVDNIELGENHVEVLLPKL